MKGQKVVMVDTPGFDDTYRSQADILNDIAVFLEKAYEKGKKISGVIYMHRISDTRMGGIARENFRLFTKICGPRAMANVLIVTTMWDDVDVGVGEARENELASKPLFFKDAIAHGAQMARLYSPSASSARGILEALLDRVPQVLQMQQELVEEHKSVPQTEAGTELRSELERQAEKHQGQMRELRLRMGAELQGKDAAHRQEIEEYQEELARLQKKILNAESDLQKLSQDKGKGKGGRLMAIFGRRRMHLPVPLGVYSPRRGNKLTPSPEVKFYTNGHLGVKLARILSESAKLEPDDPESQVFSDWCGPQRPSFRVLWPSGRDDRPYYTYDPQIWIRKNTRREVVFRIAKAMKNLMETHPTQPNSSNKWEIGVGPITFERLVLHSVQRISSGSIHAVLAIDMQGV
ncbi:uncharacterized protein FIBRA_06009 [Fibroporia radiculosa]|uniref:G domain-containing protein n=1 Tax=Fibroporia radiculosa TaxID=599839 RepID=J4H3U6_9APHY|nr:uncharacterized protein FIBRA_06009 [Fibroporia radiculosa]CCM03859.1 predicted protein [Fibroporia radiculosa]